MPFGDSLLELNQVYLAILNGKKEQFQIDN